MRIANARYFGGDYEGAVSLALRALGQPNFQWPRYAVLIASLGQLGHHDEARRYIDEVMRERPEVTAGCVRFPIAFVRNTHLFGEQDIMDRYCEGLRKAAVSEAA